MNSERKYRMYGMVNYQLSGIQKGIQFGHAVVEYGITYGNTEEYLKWSKNDKTFIILNGGTTNTRIESLGTLNKIPEILQDLGIRHETFYETDLGDQLTAVVFLVDDRVYDREAWPDYAGHYYADGRTPVAEDFWNWKMKFDKSEKIADKIVYLRTWLKEFRLA
jgi:hypothetical protein